MITNTCLHIANEHLSIQFYIENLNFELSSSVTFEDSEQWWFLERAEDDCSRLVLIKKNEKSNCTGSLIINIPDCVYEYCKLKQTNVVGLSEPKYSSIGLAISFFDPNGNRIILLEERNYEEPFNL